jgi:hypothetical protein
MRRPLPTVAITMPSAVDECRKTRVFAFMMFSFSFKIQKGCQWHHHNVAIHQTPKKD